MFCGCADMSALLKAATRRRSPNLPLFSGRFHLSHVFETQYERASYIKHQPSNFLKEDFEKLNAVPLPRDVWIEGRAFNPGTVSGWCPRIQHLERIMAGAKRSRNHSLNRRPHGDGRRCRHCSDRLLRPDRRGQFLGRSGCNQPSQERDQ